MKRIICHKCGEKFYLKPEYEIEGWNMRRNIIEQIRIPADHKIIITSDRYRYHTEIPLPMILCDSCGDEIPEGNRAVAITFWRDEEPELWELDYTGPNPGNNESQ